MVRNPNLVGSLAIAGIMLSAGYFIAEAGASHPVGIDIPKQREHLRREGAQGEAVRAGKESPQQAVKDVDVETHGGDKGMRIRPK